MQVLSLPVLNGWGLTETSPVLSCRRSVPPRENVRGSVGLPIPGTQVRVVDPETLSPLPEGQKVGLQHSAGPAPSNACSCDCQAQKAEWCIFCRTVAMAHHGQHANLRVVLHCRV